MIIIMITIMIDEEARTYAFQGVRQKLLSGSSASAKEVSPPPTSCPLAENHFAKKTLAAMGGTYTDFTTYAASEKKGYHAWNGVDWRLSLLLRSAKA